MDDELEHRRNGMNPGDANANQDMMVLVSGDDNGVIRGQSNDFNGIDMGGAVGGGDASKMRFDSRGGNDDLQGAVGLAGDFGTQNNINNNDNNIGDDKYGADGFGLGATLGRGDDYVARYPIVALVGVGKCVHKIISFNDDQRKRKHRNNGLDEFWRPFVKEYFAPNSKMLLDVYNKNTNKSISIELRADIIARVFKAKYDSGVVEERAPALAATRGLAPYGTCVRSYPTIRIGAGSLDWFHWNCSARDDPNPEVEALPAAFASSSNGSFCRCIDGILFGATARSLKLTAFAVHVYLPSRAVLRLFIDDGITACRLLLENPCEFLLQKGVVVVDCPRATIMTTFAESRVFTEGHLRVSFSEDLKILCWEFSTRIHEELVQIDMQKEPQPSANELGLPQVVSECMQIADVLNELRDNISSAASTIARQSNANMQPESSPQSINLEHTTPE